MLVRNQDAKDDSDLRIDHEVMEHPPLRQIHRYLLHYDAQSSNIRPHWQALQNLNPK